MSSCLSVFKHNVEYYTTSLINVHITCSTAIWTQKKMYRRSGITFSSSPKGLTRGMENIQEEGSSNHSWPCVGTVVTFHDVRWSQCWSAKNCSSSRVEGSCKSWRIPIGLCVRNSFQEQDLRFTARACGYEAHKFNHTHCSKFYGLNAFSVQTDKGIAGSKSCPEWTKCSDM